MDSGWATKSKNWNRVVGRLPIFLLIFFWASRLPSLQRLPLHNDEGLHLTRAFEVWNGHPFWTIQDGKIVNHFLIAALIPQANPIIAARLPTILISLIGLAAGMALAQRIGGRRARLVLFAGAIPLLTILLVGREVMSRHFVVALPIFAILAGIGWDNFMLSFARIVPRACVVIATGLMMCLVCAAVPFALIAYREPALLPLSDVMRTQYITEHPSGYGLRAAMWDLPFVTNPDVPIVGSMFPDSCRRANFYATAGYALLCSDAPGVDLMRQLVAQFGTVYVLSDTAPLIGVDLNALAALFPDLDIERVQVYPRPDESIDTASVALWWIKTR